MTAIPKPRMFHADLAKLPAALLPLTLQKRWVIWKLERRGDHWTKPPFQPKFYNEPAKSDDPSTWGTYADAVLAVVQGHADGIGYALKGSGLAAIDLDHVRDLLSGRVLPWAEALFSEAIAAGAYVEWTVSGTGARIIGLGAGDKLHKKITVHKQNGCACEFYRDCERYITISGMQISPGDYPGLPVPTALPKFDLLFDAFYARFTDAKQRPAASECEFAPGLVIGIEAIEPAKKPLDFNDVGPQVDHDDVIANGVPQGGRSEAFQSAVWHLASQGKTAEQIAEELAKHPAGIGAEYAGRLLAEVRRSYGKWQQQRQANATGTSGASVQAAAAAPWPTIYIKQGEIPRVVDEAEAALLQLGREIYQYGDVLVEAHLKLIKASGGREFLGWRLPELTVMNLVEHFSCAARFMKFDKRSNAWVQTDVPEKIAKAYLDRKGKRVPQVVGIANAPFLRADGTICDREGYDPATSILCKWDGLVFPPVSPNPTRDDALASLAILEEPLAEFPFVSPADKSAALSAMLTALDRKGMDIAPLHAFTAPAAGTGKGLLIDVIAVIATGRPMAVDNQGHDEEEQEKRLGASLIEGDGLIEIDNCERVLEGAFLNSVVTQHVVKVRVLGKSKKVECPNTASFFANGNNLIIGADMTRRVILCEMDARVERPETRKFKNSRLLETVRAKRIELVLAGLTLLRAWHVIRPAKTIDLKPLDFIEWTERVRKALVWLGRSDPGDTMEKARENDPYRIKRSIVLTEWYRVLNERPVLVREVIAAAFGDPDFYAALLTVADARNGKEISPDRLGRWLTKNKGGIAGNLMLVRTGSIPGGSPIWLVRKV